MQINSLSFNGLYIDSVARKVGGEVLAEAEEGLKEKAQGVDVFITGFTPKDPKISEDDEKIFKENWGIDPYDNPPGGHVFSMLDLLVSKEEQNENEQLSDHQIYRKRFNAEQGVHESSSIEVGFYIETKEDWKKEVILNEADRLKFDYFANLNPLYSNDSRVH